MARKGVKNLLDPYLNTEHVLLLCQRCHYTHEKGMVLCELRRENYHRPRYNYLFNCKDKGFTFCPSCHIFFNK
ncbi:MAG: hypothetical protein P8Y97_11855 [Candidatus Lokiarchaeota archaeon]